MQLLLVLFSMVLVSQDQEPASQPASTPNAAVSPSSQTETTLRAVLAANIANSTQYRRGQMAIRLRTERGLEAKVTIYDMLVRWSGQSVACDYVQRQISKSEEEPTWAGAPTLETPGLTRLATAPGANTAIYRSTGAVGAGSQPQFIFFKAGRESMDLRDFQMRPDQAWFNVNRNIQIRTMLDAIVADGKFEQKQKYLQIEGSRIIFGGADAQEKKQLMLEFSLAHGGNAVKFVHWSSQAKRKEYLSRGSWTWAQLPDQRWYLKSLESEDWSDELSHPKKREIYEKNRKERPEYYDLDGESKATWQMRLDVHEFTPDPKWDVNPFDPSHWKVATGTLVDDMTGPSKIRYRFGEGATDPTAEINALVERLKKKKR